MLQQLSIVADISSMKQKFQNQRKPVFLKNILTHTLET